MSFKSEAQIVFHNGSDGGGEADGGGPQAPGVSSSGSIPTNPIAASNAAEMPGFPGMMGMPMMMPGGGGPGGMTPNDSRLADEFVKLQQDFFKWQQQLLQNQHVLHSRVAPLASNPPQLQSVGVMRDIMSQEAPAEVAPVASVRSGPVERIIPIKMEMTTSSTTSSTSSTNFGGNELRPSAAPGRLSQSMQDISISDAGQPGLSSRVASQQVPTQRRWPNEPNVSVGAWNERPSQPVGVYRDQDYVTSSPKSRSTQDLSSPSPAGPGMQYQQQRPAPATFQPAQTDAQAPQQFAQPQFAQPQAPVHAQQFQALPPQQQRQFAQFLQQQQQRQEPDRATFWRDFDSKRGGAEETDFAKQQLRNSYQEPVSSQDESSKPLTYFGQDVLVQDPPMTYYYNGDGAAKPVGNSFVSSRPKASESEGPGPRYTSVVTVSPDKEIPPGGESATKDKVKSVVQLNNDQPRNVPRQVAPVVRGFRQPGEDKAGAQGGTFHSKIINSAGKPQPQPSSNIASSSVAPARGTSPPQSVPILEAPTAARLVAAVSQQAPRGPSPAPVLSSSSRVSPPKTGPSQVAPSRTSPSPRSSPSSGPAFAGVQLKPVPAALRASPPPAPVLPPPPPSASQSGVAPPPPPPPAPPMAPPPPPPMTGAPERRTASGKRIVSAKTGPELDAREELMVAIKNHGGLSGLRRTGNFAFSNES